jgi:hypothetical protein
MIYLVEGYNKNDYLTEMYNWELLKSFDNRAAAYDFLIEMESTGYRCRIVESKIELQPGIIDPKEDVHWEIFTGV